MSMADSLLHDAEARYFVPFGSKPAVAIGHRAMTAEVFTVESGLVLCEIRAFGSERDERGKVETLHEIGDLIPAAVPDGQEWFLVLCR